MKADVPLKNGKTATVDFDGILPDEIKYLKENTAYPAELDSFLSEKKIIPSISRPPAPTTKIPPVRITPAEVFAASFRKTAQRHLNQDRRPYAGLPHGDVGATAWEAEQQRKTYGLPPAGTPSKWQAMSIPEKILMPITAATMGVGTGAVVPTAEMALNIAQYATPLGIADKILGRNDLHKAADTVAEMDAHFGNLFKETGMEDVYGAGQLAGQFVPIAGTEKVLSETGSIVGRAGIKILLDKFPGISEKVLLKTLDISARAAEKGPVKQQLIRVASRMGGEINAAKKAYVLGATYHALTTGHTEGINEAGLSFAAFRGVMGVPGMAGEIANLAGETGKAGLEKMVSPAAQRFVMGGKGRPPEYPLGKPVTPEGKPPKELQLSPNDTRAEELYLKMAQMEKDAEGTGIDVTQFDVHRSMKKEFDMLMGKTKIPGKSKAAVEQGLKPKARIRQDTAYVERQKRILQQSLILRQKYGDYRAIDKVIERQLKILNPTVSTGMPPPKGLLTEPQPAVQINGQAFLRTPNMSDGEIIYRLRRKGIMPESIKFGTLVADTKTFTEEPMPESLPAIRLAGDEIEWNRDWKYVNDLYKGIREKGIKIPATAEFGTINPQTGEFVKASMGVQSVLKTASEIPVGFMTQLAKMGTGGASHALKWAADVIMPIHDVPAEAVTALRTDYIGGLEEAKLALNSATRTYERTFGKMSVNDQIAFMNRIYNGEKQPAQELQGYADYHKRLFDEQYERAKTFKDTDFYKENYQGMIWKVKPTYADAEAKALYNNYSSRGLFRGTEGQFKQQLIENVSEGMAHGGIPISYNPVVLDRAVYNNMEKFIGANLAVGKMIEDGILGSGLKENMPLGYEDISSLAKKMGINPEEGQVVWGERNTMRVFRNIMSKDTILSSDLGKNVFAIKNSWTQAELFYPGFHTGFTFINAALSDFMRGLTQFVNTMDVKGAYTAGKAFVPGVSQIQTYMLGDAAIKSISFEDYLTTSQGRSFIKAHPNGVEIARLGIRNGLLTVKPGEYSSDIVKSLKETIQNKEYVKTAYGAVFKSMEAVGKPLFDIVIPREKFGMFMKLMEQEIKQNAGRLARGKAMLDAGKSEQYVLNHGETTENVLARKVIGHVERIMGEVNWQNYMLNNNVKRVLQLLARSPMWKYGSFVEFAIAPVEQLAEINRAIGMPLKQRFAEWRTGVKNETPNKPFEKPLLTQGTAFVLGVMSVGYMTAEAIQYWRTGKHVGDTGVKGAKVGSEKWMEMVFEDILHPRITKGDDSIRVNNWTYLKEPEGFQKDPVNYVKSSMSGVISKAFEVQGNKTYQGMQVYDPDDPWLLKAAKITGHLIPIPISTSFAFTSYKKLVETGIKPADAFIITMLGLIKARKSSADTPAMRRLWELNSRNPLPGMNQKQFERVMLMRELKIRLIKGDDIRNEAIGYVKSRKLHPDDIKTIYQKAQFKDNPWHFGLKYKTFEDAYSVYQLGSLEEKKMMIPVLFRKLVNSESLTGDEKIKYRNIFLKDLRGNK